MPRPIRNNMANPIRSPLFNMLRAQQQPAPPPMPYGPEPDPNAGGPYTPTSVEELLPDTQGWGESLNGPMPTDKPEDPMFDYNQVQQRLQMMKQFSGTAKPAMPTMPRMAPPTIEGPTFSDMGAGFQQKTQPDTIQGRYSAAPPTMNAVQDTLPQGPLKSGVDSMLAPPTPMPDKKKWFEKTGGKVALGALALLLSRLRGGAKETAGKVLQGTGNIMVSKALADQDEYKYQKAQERQAMLDQQNLAYQQAQMQHMQQEDAYNYGTGQPDGSGGHSTLGTRPNLSPKDQAALDLWNTKNDVTQGQKTAESVAQADLKAAEQANPNNAFSLQVDSKTGKMTVVDKGPKVLSRMQEVDFELKQTQAELAATQAEIAQTDASQRMAADLTPSGYATQEGGPLLIYRYSEDNPFKSYYKSYNDLVIKSATAKDEASRNQANAEALAHLRFLNDMAKIAAQNQNALGQIHERGKEGRSNIIIKAGIDAAKPKAAPKEPAKSKDDEIIDAYLKSRGK